MNARQGRKPRQRPRRWNTARFTTARSRRETPTPSGDTGQGMREALEEARLFIATYWEKGPTAYSATLAKIDGALAASLSLQPDDGVREALELDVIAKNLAREGRHTEAGALHRAAAALNAQAARAPEALKWRLIEPVQHAPWITGETEHVLAENERGERFFVPPDWAAPAQNTGASMGGGNAKV